MTIMYRLIIILVSGFFVLLSHPILISAKSDAIVIKALNFPDGGFLRIQASDTLILDTNGFYFKGERNDSDTPPDTIALHIQPEGGSFYYSLPFSPEQRRYQINAKSLRARGNAPPFEKFSQDASAFLMVGNEVGDDSLDIGVFADQWNLMLDFE